MTNGSRPTHGSKLTRSKDLREDALLVGAVDVVRRLARLVGAVQQAAIFRVPQQQLGQTPAPPPDGDVKGRVPFLKHRKQEAGRILHSKSPSFEKIQLKYFFDEEIRFNYSR